MADERTEPTEAEARARSQAAALLGRARSLHIEIEQASSGVESSSAKQRMAAIIANLAGAEAQLSQVVDGLGARGADLAGLELLLQGSELAADDAVHTAAAHSAAADGAADLAETTAATRREMQTLSNELFRDRIYEPYLHFGSKQEEEEYRTREAQRQRQIEELLATGKPGDALVASSLGTAQMLDACDHGAGDHPQFMENLRRHNEQDQRQRAVTAANVSNDNRSELQQHDEITRRAVRASLERKGVPAAQIAQVLASPDPVQAALPYLSSSLAPREREQAPQAAAEPDHPWQGEPGTPAARHAEADAPSAPRHAPARARAAIAAVAASVSLEDDGIGGAAPRPRAAGSTAPAAAAQARTAVAALASSVSLDDDGIGGAPPPQPGNGHGLPDQARPAAPPVGGRAVT